MAKTSKKRQVAVVKKKSTLYRKVEGKTSGADAGNIVEEPAFPAVSPPLAFSYKIAKPLPLAYWLGGSKQINTIIRSDFDVIEISQEGISKGAIDTLTTYLGITRKAMAEDIFGMSVKTLERKTPGEKLDKQTSSHALEIAKVMQHAYEVFQDEEKVKHWINRENRSLNNLTPVSLFGTLTGLNLVNDILGRIEEGVYS